MKHNLTLENTKSWTWFDLYRHAYGLSDEEVEEMYGTREELSEISNYFADLLDNGIKIAELEYANFESMPDWAEVGFNRIESQVLVDALEELNADFTGGDIDAEVSLDNFEARYDSTPEAVFSEIVQIVENQMNRE